MQQPDASPEFDATKFDITNLVTRTVNFSGSASPSITIDAVGWVHVSDRRLLCVRAQDKDAFYLPGGKREAGESDWEAIAREVREEIGLSLLAETLTPFSTIQSAAHGHGPNAEVVLLCYEADFMGEIEAKAEIAEVAWFGWNERHRCAPATAIVLEQLWAQGRIES